jgi:hypothetical protein
VISVPENDVDPALLRRLHSAKHVLSAANATLGDRPLRLLHVWSPPSTVLADAFGAKDFPAGPSTSELERLASGRAQAIAGEVEALARRLVPTARRAPKA